MMPEGLRKYREQQQRNFEANTDRIYKNLVDSGTLRTIYSIADDTGLRPGTIRKHLRVLQNLGLVKNQRRLIQRKNQTMNVKKKYSTRYWAVRP